MFDNNSPLKNIWKNSLATKQLTYILLFSSLITLISASLQIYLEYKSDIDQVKSQINQIENGHLKSLTNSLWKLDDDQIKVQLNDALSLRDIIFLEIQEGDSAIFTVGKLETSDSNISTNFPMLYKEGEVVTKIGKLIVVASLGGIYDRLFNRIFYIFTAQTIKTFLVSFFILFIVHRLVTIHLLTIAEEIKKINVKGSRKDIFLKRKKSNSTNYDELDFLVSSFNEMQKQLYLDLEKQKQQQTVIRENEEKYRLLVDTAPYGIQLADNDGKILFSNPAHHKLQGYPDGELVGKYIWDLIAEEKDKELIKKHYQALINEQPHPEIYFSKDKKFDGQLIDVQINWDYIRNSNNDVTGTISIVSDITSQKKAEDALKTAHKRFITVLDSIDATVYVVDMNTYEILFMNKNMIKSFDRDMTGEICWKVYRGEKKPCLHCPIDKIVNKEGKPTGVHIWQAKNSITQRWYINYDRAIEWTDGRIVKLQIATDITDFKKLEDELRQTHKMESIGILAGGIAHDFNNILSIILGNTELALSDIPEWSPANDSLNEIKTASIRAKEVVRQLLSFSRKAEKKYSPQNLIQLIKESTKLIRSSIPSNIDIIEKLPISCNPILADATQIHQVIINLCTNASHAMSENGGILEIHLNEITLKKRNEGKYENFEPGDYIELVIKDNGSGIDPNITNQIFDPYFTTKEVGKGTGMGLAVVHGIIKNHNGTVFVDSQLGKGSSFFACFPAFMGGKEKKLTPKIETTYSGSGKILFVDDEKPIVEMSVKILTKLGYTVVGKSKPMEAIKEFENNPNDFDVIITDMTMPIMDGLEFSKRIKTIRSEIPIIMCTGDNTVINHDIGKRSGISAYVLKPVSMNKIAKIISKVIGS